MDLQTWLCLKSSQQERKSRYIMIDFSSVVIGIDIVAVIIPFYVCDI